MASNNITFDPDSGVPYGANLSIYTGGDFKAKFNVFNTSSSAFNLTGYSGSGSNEKEHFHRFYNHCCCDIYSRDH